MKLAPLVCALILASCTDGDSPTGSGSPTDVIVPLRVGNSWQYTATLYDSDGAGYAWQNYTLEILQDTLLNNEKCYFVGGERTLVVNRFSGLWGFDLGSAPSVEQFDVFPSVAETPSVLHYTSGPPAERGQAEDAIDRRQCSRTGTGRQ